MPNVHASNPIPFRPAADDRAWLVAHAKATGRPVNAILAQALRLLRTQAEKERRNVSAAADKKGQKMPVTEYTRETIWDALTARGPRSCSTKDRRGYRAGDGR